MSDDVFGSAFAQAYDHWYEKKDYESECDDIEQLFERHFGGKVRAVLDIGCGTGGHSIPLARRGYSVTGVDRSEAMLEIAKEKAESQVWKDGTKPPEFHHGDATGLALDERFDAVLMMFAVLGYQATNEQLTSALDVVKRHLNPGGLFAGDVWYGPAVLTQRPSDRVSVVETGDTELIRTASTSIDSLAHMCTVHYQLWELRAKRLVNRQREDHVMRFFFPMELDHLMRTNGIELVSLHPFGDLEGRPSEDTWNVMFCGQALA